ncbi:unnamed protein product [Symbiodinium sp. CCMP2592]|nr:unnamed protein product [Symbiodinium sp. CCMP2592]
MFLLIVSFFPNVQAKLRAALENALAELDKDDEREAKRRKTAKTVEVVDLIKEEPQAVVCRQSSQDSLDSSQTARGVKRQASFHTPSPKKRLFSPDSKGGDSQSPGSQSPGSQSRGSQSPDSNPVQKRKIEQLKKTLGQGSPVYYRLDYLWGKAAEAEAKPGLSPDTASDRQKQQQAENLQNLQEKASQAVEKLGLEPAVGVLKKRQGGRPLGSKQKTKPDTVRQAGSHLGLVHLVSKSTGRRLPDPGKVLGRPDFLQPVWSETRAWALNASQHVLTSTDVLMDFEERLDKAIAVRQAEQEKGLLDQTGEKELAAMVQKKASLASKPKQRSKYQVQLLAKCGLRNRSCQQTANLSKEDEKARLDLSWRLWDMLLEQAASPTPQPDLPVASPEQWTIKRAETAITMSDQVPAWLKPTPGKVLTSVVRLKLASEQSKAPRLACASRAPGVAARWRISLVARQAVQNFFAPDRQPVGVVMPTIIVTYGKHCRLENISQEGTWIKSECFQVGSQTVRRRAGQRVPGQVMRTWRKLRDTQPHLFDGSVRVWCQPAAVVDSVIYRWQLELESEEHSQAVQLVDTPGGAWTTESMHAAALLQRAQTGIAAGCTGLTQVTDIGFAQPAKAALRRWQEDLKQRMREKARQQKVQCTYKTGPADILEAARQMHARMVQLKTVVRCMRQGGWFHFRPDSEGRLHDCGSQKWCLDFPEGNAKLGSDHLRDRSRWVDKTGKVLPWTEADSKTFDQSNAFEPEATYLLGQTDIHLSFRAKPNLLAQSERELREVILRQVHPNQRRRLFQEQVDQTTSQTKTEKQQKKEKRIKNAKQDRKRRKLLKEWRQQQANKTKKQALLSVVPKVGQKKAKKKASKGDKKPSEVKKQQKKDQAKKAQRRAAEPGSEGHLHGKQARVIGDLAPQTLLGKIVVCGNQTDSQVLINADGFHEWVSHTDITLDVRDRQFPLVLDFESFPSAAASEEAAASAKDLRLYKHEELLTDSQLEAGIREMSYRFSHGADPASLCVLRPAEAKQLIQTHTLKAAAKTAMDSQAGLVLAVVQSQPPRHWSLLVVETVRDSPEAKVRYYDTLPGLQGSQCSFEGAAADSQETGPAFACASQSAQTDRRLLLRPLGLAVPGAGVAAVDG